MKSEAIGVYFLCVSISEGRTGKSESFREAAEKFEVDKRRGKKTRRVDEAVPHPWRFLRPSSSHQARGSGHAQSCPLTPDLNSNNDLGRGNAGSWI